MDKIGLVLEGGGMRGIYTAGVLDCLLDYEIETDGVIGVSAGACHATSYLSKQRERNFRVNTKYLKDKEYLSLHSLLKTGSLFGMDMLFNRIPHELEPYDYDTFYQSKSELIIVSTNIETGEPDYHVMKDMDKEIGYIQASSSLPLLAQYVEIDGKKLMDGGCSDSIPVQYMRRHGYRKNLVILTQHKDYRKGKNNLLPIIKHNYKEYPKLVDALANRHFQYNRTLDELAYLQRQGEVFIIQPSEPLNISRIEKNIDKLKKVYQLGYEDCEKQMKALQAFMAFDTAAV